MKNPCHTCDRAELDKEECALECERRHEYCRYMGIPTGEYRSFGGQLDKPTLVHTLPTTSPTTKNGHLEIATDRIRSGRGNREVCRATGMSLRAVAKLRMTLEIKNGGPFLCGCGRKAVHQGLCNARINRFLDENRILEMEVKNLL